MRYTLSIDIEVESNEDAEAFDRELTGIILTGTDAEVTLIDTTLRRES